MQLFYSTVADYVIKTKEFRMYAVEASLKGDRKSAFTPPAENATFHHFPTYHR